MSWTTYGFDPFRSGFNPYERLIDADNVARLHLEWRIALPGVTIASPLDAANVGGRELVYVATERGVVDAVDPSTGAPVWTRRLGSIHTACSDLPAGRFGVSATPAIDEARGLLYVAASNTSGVFLHALVLSSGREAPGWPLRVSADPDHMHVWGAVGLSHQALYVAFAGLCDAPPYYGKVVEVPLQGARPTRIRQWFVVRDGPYGMPGGGIWGFGGVGIDPRNGDLYAATGNSLPPGPQDRPDGESIVRLTPRLNELASNHPELTGVDADFGATPMLFQVPGCPAQLVAPNKSGSLFLYERDRIDRGPVQRLEIAANAGDGTGRVIGVAAFDPQTRMVYLADPGPSNGRYEQGLVAFDVGRDCRLHQAWQNGLATATATPFSSPSIADGVVYVGDGLGARVLAFDARTGTRLWDGGDPFTGAVYAPPIVVNGRVFVASWDGAKTTVSAFSPAP